MIIRCCRECKRREIGCHSTCEKYIEEKEQWEKNKAAGRRNRGPIVRNCDFNMLACMHRARKR